MEEQYYLIPKLVVDELIEYHKGTHWGHAISALINKSTLVDLSDDSIKKEALKSKNYSEDRFDNEDHAEIAYYVSALTNLKNKLNGNK